MFNLQPLEMAAIFLVILLIFGPKRLPEMGKAIGSAITEFRNSMSGRKPAAGDEAKLAEENRKEEQDNTPAG